MPTPSWIRSRPKCSEEEAAAAVEDVLRQDANAENAAFANSTNCWPPSPRSRSTRLLSVPVLDEPDLVPATTDTTAGHRGCHHHRPGRHAVRQRAGSISTSTATACSPRPPKVAGPIRG